MTWSPGFSVRHAGADLAHDARALVAEDRREHALRIGARQRVGVGVADAGRLDLDQHLAGLRPVDVHGLDGKRFSRLPGDGCAGLHGSFPPSPTLLFDCAVRTPARRWPCFRAYAETLLTARPEVCMVSSYYVNPIRSTIQAARALNNIVKIFEFEYNTIPASRMHSQHITGHHM